jgi:hypothetical protein
MRFLASQTCYDNVRKQHPYICASGRKVQDVYSICRSKRNCHDFYLANSSLSNQRLYYRCKVTAHLSWFVIQKLSRLKILQLTTIFFARWYKLAGSRSVPHSGSSNPHSGSSNPHSGSSNSHSISSNPHSGSSNPPATEPPIPVEIKAGQGVELSLDNFQVKLLCFNCRLIYPKLLSSLFHKL